MHYPSFFSRRRLGEDEADLEGKLDPTIRYLLALGPKYLTLIFESSRWVFDADFDWAMKVCTISFFLAILPIEQPRSEHL